MYQIEVENAIRKHEINTGKTTFRYRVLCLAISNICVTIGKARDDEC